MSEILRALIRSRVTGLLFGFAIILIAGCGGGKGNVTGKVSYKGQPLPYGNVQFSTSGGAFVSEIASDGSYSISGVPTGSAKITVNCQDPGYVEYMKALSSAGRDPKAPKPKGKPEDFDRIPTKYNSFETSGLTYDVKSGNTTFDIDLK